MVSGCDEQGGVSIKANDGKGLCGQGYMRTCQEEWSNGKSMGSGATETCVSILISH